MGRRSAILPCSLTIVPTLRSPDLRPDERPTVRKTEQNDWKLGSILETSRFDMLALF